MRSSPLYRLRSSKRGQGLTLRRALYMLYLIFPLCLASLMFSCNEEVTRVSAERARALNDTLNIKINGGNFTRIQSSPWGEQERYEVELALESLSSNLTVTSRGCKPALITFKARYHSSRYQLFTRVYEGVNQGRLTLSEQSARGLIQSDKELWRPSSSTRALTHPRVELITWSILMNAVDEPVVISAEDDLSQVVSLEEINKRSAQCIQRRSTSSTSQDRLLVRHRLEYQWTSPFKIGVSSGSKGDVDHLRSLLQGAERSGLQGIILLGDLSAGDEESLKEIRETLAETPLFWWALPGFNERELTSEWLDEIGALNYALDIEYIRLMFLDLALLTLSESQLQLISRWINVTPLNRLDELQPHSSALFSMIPLVQGGSSDTRGLDYRIGAIRTLSALRTSHLTHHITTADNQVDGVRTTEAEQTLGVETLYPPQQSNQLLELTLTPECAPDGRGADCIKWSTLELP